MKIQSHKIKSQFLGEVFEFKQYGEKGKIIFAFPCSQGHYFDYENFGMIEVYKSFIEQGKVTLFSLDSRDNASWFCEKKDQNMGVVHRNFERCVTEEVIPFIKRQNSSKEKFLITGNSWGAYHALNFILKFPQFFEGAICLSGVYRLSSQIGNYFDETVYYNDILRYLPQLSDEAFLDPLKKAYIILSHGNGKWEDHKHEAKEVADLLKEKGIPHLYDPWGEEWNHDWPTWKAQIPHYLQKLCEGVLVQGKKKIFIP